MTSSSSKKTITNLTQQPQLRATLFEPISPSTFDLGSTANEWLEIYTNRVEEPLPTRAGMEVVIPAGTGGAGDPPATQALNRNLEYYFKFTNAASFAVWKYPASHLPAVQVFPTTGAIFWNVTDSNMYFLKNASTNQWLTYNVN